MGKQTTNTLSKVKEIPAWMWFAVTLVGLGIDAYTSRVDLEKARLQAERAQEGVEQVQETGAESEREIIASLRDTQLQLRGSLLTIQTRLVELEADNAIYRRRIMLDDLSEKFGLPESMAHSLSIESVPSDVEPAKVQAQHGLPEFKRLKGKWRK